MSRDGDTRPLYNPHSGQTELETQLIESTDPALLRLHLRRLSALVDGLVARQAGPALASADELWAVRQQLAMERLHGRRRDVAALVLGSALVGWTAVITAILVAVMVAQ